MHYINDLLFKTGLRGVNQQSVNTDEALQTIIKQMGLRETYMQGVYCEQHNPNMPKGNYTNQRHYVWNETTKQMEELPGIYYISSQGRDKNGSSINNAALQSRIQGYAFTETDGVYSKDGKNYKYNSQKNSFEEVENNNSTVNDTKNNQTSVIDQLEEITNDDVKTETETESKPNKLPAKEAVTEKRTGFGDGKYSIAQIDADGELIYETIYNPDGSIHSTTEYEYYDDGSQKHISKDENGLITNINIFDKQGRKIGSESYRNGKLMIEIKKEYNEDGSYTEIRDWYLEQGQEHNVIKYDANDKRISCTTTKPDGTVTNTHCYNCDDGTYVDIEISEAGEIYSISAGNGEESFAFTGQYSIESCKQKIADIEKELQDIRLESTTLDIPVPPDKQDFTDDDEYDSAMKEYQEERQRYNDELQNLNNKQTNLIYNLSSYENMLAALEFVNYTTETQSYIADLRTAGDDKAADEMQENLDKLKEDFTHIFVEKSNADNEWSKLTTDFNNLNIPTPPNKNDFLDDEDFLDVAAYKIELNKYEEAKNEFDQKSNELEEVNKAVSDLKTKLKNITRGQFSSDTENYTNTNTTVLIRDEAGNIIRESKVNSDGSRSSFYHTYKDGELVQTQKTIHYKDGSYTYIIEDAENSTTDINLYDKRGRNIGYKSYRDEQLIGEEKREYNEDGSYTEVSDWYSEQGHEHYINKYDADGTLVSGTNTKSDKNLTNAHCYNYNDGTYMNIEINEAGKIYAVNAGNGEAFHSYNNFLSIESCKQKIADTEKELQDIQLEYTSLDIPVPPDRQDISDDDEYDSAMKEYQEERQRYNDELQNLNNKQKNLMFNLNSYENMLAVLEFVSYTTKSQSNIADLRAKDDDKTADEIQEKLDKLAKKFTNLFVGKNKIDSEWINLMTELF